MKFVIKEGKRLRVLRPENPQAALAHAHQALQMQHWHNYAGKVTFIGYLATGLDLPPKILNEKGEEIGQCVPGDIFALEQQLN